MITILIVIALCAWAYGFYKFYDDGEGIAFALFFPGFLVAIFGGFACIFVVLGGRDFLPQRELNRANQRVEIASLRTQEGLSGSFFLGSGTISQTEYYYMLKRTERGGVVRLQLRAHDCYIFEDEQERPNVSWQVVTYAPPAWYTWPGWIDLSYERRTAYDIHVPRGTIIQQFSVQ